MENLFGARLRQARLNAGLTQAALAEKVNLDETTISRIENGSQATSFQSMLHFSDALDVHLDYLLCDYLEHGPENPDMLTREITELLEPLPDSYKLFIRDTVRSLVQNFPVPTESKKQP
ncbi:MAG TPA: helix-turn-helix domain-containing protein [Candidatus Bariatricus faecipullorum]|nr:helix-turn-helix domain-containing protein [Candidatus Bariatricus faecipullorum]